MKQRPLWVKKKDGTLLTFYQFLGVAENCSEDELKKAYRKLAREFHPDVNKGDQQKENTFKVLSHVYEMLTKRRSEYDGWLREHRNPQPQIIVQFNFGGGSNGSSTATSWGNPYW